MRPAKHRYKTRVVIFNLSADNTFLKHKLLVVETPARLLYRYYTSALNGLY